MKHYKILIGLTLLVMAVTSCSKEDELSPSGKDTNSFEVAADDNSAEARLRRNFYNSYGSYLLFNDTLSTGEKLELEYVMTSSDHTVAYSYSYLQSFEDKEVATRFVEQKILPHLGKKLRPFSFLLVGTISKWKYDGYTYSNPDDGNTAPTSVVGQRGTAIAMDNVLSLDEAGQKEYAASLLSDILANAIAGQTGETMDAFYAYSKNYYEGYMEISPTDSDENMQYMNKAGFIVPHYAYGFEFIGAYPSKAEDVKGFVKLVLNSSADDVENQYGAYPDIIAKYRLIAHLLNDLGYVK